MPLDPHLFKLNYFAKIEHFSRQITQLAHPVGIGRIQFVDSTH